MLACFMLERERDKDGENEEQGILYSSKVILAQSVGMLYASKGWRKRKEERE